LLGINRRVGATTKCFDQTQPRCSMERVGKNWQTKLQNKG
jgi:hypothetical protein